MAALHTRLMPIPAPVRARALKRVTEYNPYEPDSLRKLAWAILKTDRKRRIARAEQVSKPGGRFDAP